MGVNVSVFVGFGEGVVVIVGSSVDVALESGFAGVDVVSEPEHAVSTSVMAIRYWIRVFILFFPPIQEVQNDYRR